ncbi:MAG: S-adenosylmethionine:tRNA ribosyltransferase-isomerase [Muribaculaceae bacterium]
MTPQLISIDDYDYPLPEALIAKHPLVQRDACKLLVRESDGTIATHTFSELAGLLPADSLLVYNNTRVINARLRFRKATGALIEIFCLEPSAPADYEQNFASTGSCRWHCLVGNSKRWRDNSPLSGVITAADGSSIVLSATRLSAGDSGSEIAFEWHSSTPGAAVTFSEVINAAGVIPIPPYLGRDTEASDATDYQTVYSHIEGSVAAPTAGLHFTPAVLDDIDRRGIERHEVTLHVGAGTFQPVKTPSIGEHCMHSEFIAVNRSVIAALADAVERGKHICAVGTTSVRTLESLYHIGCLISADCWSGEVEQWYPYSADHPALPAAEALRLLLRYLDAHGLNAIIGDTRIIIAPGYTYRLVDTMITNFHQPKSTLLLLVSAFIGEGWREMYAYALSHGYRFLSYGDACLLRRAQT